MPGARFCADCGAQVSPGASDPARTPTAVPTEELRQITAVFCDIVGSTELSTRLDPEEYGALVRAYREQVDDVLTRYGGKVDKYLGDGVLIDFGWPQAHDDDAERAVLAALAIAEELSDPGAKYPLAVRIGIHTGPVLVGDMGSASHPETTALGETMNRAARLQAVAPPGGVVISASTLRIVRGVFIVEEMGPQKLAGISEAVDAFQVLRRSGVSSRLDAAGDSLSPFVSREDDLAVVLESWARAQDGKGQTVLLRGEPGIGKSRLVYEMRERLRDSPHSWLEAQASSYTQHSAFHPAIRLMERALEIRAGDTNEVKHDKLVGGLELAGMREPDAVPLLADLLSITTDGSERLVMSPELSRRRTIEVLADWVLKTAELQPVVLLAEDLHWCDPSTLDMFERLMVQGASAPLMLVGTTRPELDASWLDHPDLIRLELTPLSEADTRDLVRSLSTGPALPDSVLERVIAETDGIPLFAEEMGRMVLESGLMTEREGALELNAPLEELDIPTTLQGSLMARLDRLSAAKRVAQLAAAIGREFDYRLLEEVSGLDADMLTHGLRRLVEDELIYQDGQPPEATYTFKHALIQDAAYRSLVKRSRRPLHRRIAEVLARDGGAGASSEVLARHWEAAEEPSVAIVHYRRAATFAADHSAHAEAIEHLRRAIGLVEGLPADSASQELEVDLQLALGSSVMAIRGYADPEIQVAYDRARSLSAELGQETQLGYTLIGLAIYYLNAGQLERCIELSDRALEFARHDDDDALALLGHVQLGIARFWQGRFEEARAHGESACTIYSRDKHDWLASRYGTDQGVAAYCVTGVALSHLGFLEQALQKANGGTELARELERPFDLAYALSWQSLIHWTRGEFSEQGAAAAEVVEICDAQGFTDFAGMGRMLRAAASAAGGGDPQAALEEGLGGVSLAASTGRRGGLPAFVVALATIQRAAGKLDDALGTIEGGLAIAEETDQPYWSADLLRIKAEMLLERETGHEDEAGAALRDAIALARDQGNRLHELAAATSLARLAALQGQPAPAELERAYEPFTEGHDTRPLRSAAEALGGVPAHGLG